MAWLSFIELDKAVVHVIRLTSFLGPIIFFLSSYLTGPKTLPNMCVENFGLWVCPHLLWGGGPSLLNSPRNLPAQVQIGKSPLTSRVGTFCLQQSSAFATSFVLGVSG